MRQTENPPYIAVLPTYNGGFMAAMLKWDHTIDDYSVQGYRPRRPSKEAAQADAAEWAKLQGVELR